ncbi:MAG TPA: hypothetical protein VJ583_07885, partial [Nitrososphaeraceae archaeon]|nr:hypothetical protein [Nitrososphaeraceae archaeon]
KLLGIRAAIAESFERIHRSNLIGMGILPLQFLEGENRKTLHLDGTEIISIVGLDDNLKPGANMQAIIQRADGSKDEITLLSRIDTQNEVEYYRHGGILQFVLRNILKK